MFFELVIVAARCPRAQVMTREGAKFFGRHPGAERRLRRGSLGPAAARAVGRAVVGFGMAKLLYHRLAKT